MEIVQVTYKHWKSGKILKCVGELIPKYNNASSDRLIIKTGDQFEDVIKETVIEVVPYDTTNLSV